MALRYLLDENIALLYRPELLRRLPELTIWGIGDPGAPPLGTLDPDILVWCEVNDCVLVTNNRRSMPGHLTDHLAAGRHAPGVFVLRPKAGLNRLLDELVLMAGASLEGEYRDRIVYVPLP